MLVLGTFGRQTSIGGSRIISLGAKFLFRAPNFNWRGQNSNLARQSFVSDAEKNRRGKFFNPGHQNFSGAKIEKAGPNF